MGTSISRGGNSRYEFFSRDAATNKVRPQPAQLYASASFAKKRNGHPCGCPSLKHRPIFARNLCPGADGSRLWCCRNCLVFSVGLLLLRLSALADVDAALEERAVFNRNTSSNHVARERAVAANVHPVAGRQVAPHFAQHHDLPRINVGRNHAVAPHGHAIAGKVDRTLHAPVNIQRLGARHLALDHQRLANRGLVRGGRAHGAGSRGFTRRRSHGWRARRGRGRTFRLGRSGRRLRLIGRLPHGMKDPFLVGIRGHWPHFRDQIELYSRPSRKRLWKILYFQSRVPITIRPFVPQPPATCRRRCILSARRRVTIPGKNSTSAPVPRSRGVCCLSRETLANELRSRESNLGSSFWVSVLVSCGCPIPRVLYEKWGLWNAVGPPVIQPRIPSKWSQACQNQPSLLPQL